MNKDDKKKTHIIVTGKGGGGSGSTDWNDITNKPDFATVATSGSYEDLTNKPTIPSVPAMAIQELTFTLEGGVKKTVEFYTAPNYFYVEDISGSDNTLSITKNNSSAPDIEVFCSTDRSNWTSMGTTSTTAITATIPANGKLYLKATANNWGTEWESNIITASGNHNVGGNIMSLLYGDNFENQTTFSTTYTFTRLFCGKNTLISAANLVLPATTLVSGCYAEMFSGCTSLTTAPALPATTLDYKCYASMFSRCPALTTAPALPATTLTRHCYAGMFEDCSALTTAPVLPATTLAMTCYSWMFSRCTSLNKVVTYAQDISADGCLGNWLGGVAAQGDFFNLGSATYESGNNGIPTGWTEHTSL